MRCDSVSEANVRSTQLSSAVGEGVAGIGVGAEVGLGLGLGVGLGVRVGVAVGLLVTDVDALGVGDAAAGANRHPDSTAAATGSANIGPVRRLRRDVTTTSTREIGETCTA